MPIEQKKPKNIACKQECTLENFSKNEFPMEYAITYVCDNTYEIVDLRSSKSVSTFKKISKVNGNCFLLELEESKMILLKFERGEAYLSKKFKEVITIFKRYILVNDLCGKRRLIPLFSYKNIDFCTWINCYTEGAIEELNHAIMDLPNGKKTILLKDSLVTSNLEFDYSPEYIKPNNLFRLVYVKKKQKYILIRLNDLKESPEYKRFVTNKYNMDYIVFVLENDNKVIFRISDFKTSKSYKDVQIINSEYADVFTGKTFTILRLRDFREAKWE